MATRIPINKEGFGFEDRQKKIWEDMESEMERRRREWEEEIEKMRKEFFMLRPENDERAGLGSGNTASAPLGMTGDRFGRNRLLGNTSQATDEARGMVVKDERGNPVFKVLFDVHDYQPEEVTVKMDADKIMVSARHEEKGGGSSVSREYSREVKLPHEVDPITLQCMLGPDGILTLEAPLPAPRYSSAIKDVTSQPVRSSPGSSGTSSPLLHTMTGLGSASTYQTSSGQKVPSSLAEPNLKAMPPVEPTFKPIVSAFHTPASAPSPSPPFGSSAHYQQQKQHVSSSTTSTQPSRADGSSPLPGYSKVNLPFSSYLTGSASPPNFPSPLKSSLTNRQADLPAEPLDKDAKFKLEVDIEDFRPDELTVKTQDKRVVVCARREEKAGNRTSSRELSREYSIPDNVNPLSIKAFFTDGGRLIVEAPYNDSSLSSGL